MIYVHTCLYKITYGSTFCNGKCLGTKVREHILKVMVQPYSEIQYGLLIFTFGCAGYLLPGEGFL